MREKARGLTDRIHGVRGELEDAVKDERTTLKEDVAPVPAVVLDDVMSLGFHPEIEGD